MFELIELVLSSPVGAFLFAGVQDTLYALVIAADCEECGFNDLGTLLFGGVLAAMLVGIAISILLRRLKERSSVSSEFVSITSNDRKP